MTRKEIQEFVYSWAMNNQDKFNAPYGILEGDHTSKLGKKFLSVTFGKARTLDVTVNIYSPSFIQVRTSQHGSQVFKDLADMKTFLQTL